VPDNESSAKIDTAISEAIEQSRQRIKDLDAEVERMERGAANSDMRSPKPLGSWSRISTPRFSGSEERGADTDEPRDPCVLLITALRSTAHLT
jgi:hypothetical protein